MIDGTETVRFGAAGRPGAAGARLRHLGDDLGHQSTSITDGRFATQRARRLANYGGDTLQPKPDDVPWR